MTLLWLVLACDPDPAPVAPAATLDCDGVDWSTSAEPFLTTWCAGCHSAALTGADRYGAPDGLDFDGYDAAVANVIALEAAALGEAPRMPPVGGTPEAGRAELARWIACGTPGEEEAPQGCDEADVGTFDGACAGPVRVEGDLRIDQDVDASCLCAVSGTLTIEGGAVRLPELAEVGGLAVTGGGSVELPRLARAGAVVVTAPGLVWLDLRDLVEVEELRVVGNPRLEGVELSRLARASGDVVFEDNVALRAVFGDLYGLVALGGDLRLVDNPSWLGFYGVGLLEEIPGDLVIRGQDAFGIVNGFTALGRVGGHLLVEENSGLRFLEGFDQLEVVGGDLVVRGHPLLEVEDAFDLLDEVGGALVVAGNPRLQELDGLLGVSAVGDLELSGSAALTSLRLASLRHVGAVRVADLPALQTLDGMQAVVTSGDVELVRLGLTQLRALPGLRQVAGHLTVEGNPRLTDLVTALGALEGVSGDVVVRGNPQLPTAAVASWVAGVAVGGAVVVEGNQP